MDRRGVKAHTFDGKGRQKCCEPRCPFASVAGLTRGQGRCPYHWAVGNWGKAWADQSLPGYERAAAQRRSTP